MKQLTWVDLGQALVLALAVLGLSGIFYSVWPNIYLAVPATASTLLVVLFAMRRAEDFTPGLWFVLAVFVVTGIATLLNAPNGWWLTLLVVTLCHLAVKALGGNPPQTATTAAGAH